MPTKANSQNTREIRSVSVKKLIDDYMYRIDLDADYQREKIWSREDQERLLDSIIQNIDIPKIYLARSKNNDNFDFECIDGKQRMATLLNFFKPDRSTDKPLAVRIAGERFSYSRLKKELASLAEKIEDFQLTLVIYPASIDDLFIREIFRRLQLGVRLNSGEMLNSHTGTIRDFVYKQMGKDAPFFRHTNLSEKRYSRQFALAQICINSFGRNETGAFVRARYDDLEDFFKEKYNIEHDDANLTRIQEVLELMDKHFDESASHISSRAVAVSAYLFVEGLYLRKEVRFVARFAKFYIALLEEIKMNQKLLSAFRVPKNSKVLEEFQKYISQASAEPYSFKRRDKFLDKAFEYYLAPETEGTIIGNK
jgi:hypothetical protein